MPKKSSSVLNLYTKPIGVEYRHILNNGSYVASGTKSPASPFLRKKGNEATLLDQYGTDGRFRPCYHVQKEWVILGNPPSVQTADWPKTSTPTNYRWAYYQSLGPDVHARRYGGFVSAADSMVSTLSLDWNAMSAEALATMLPSFSGGNSVINFIIELKDFRSTGLRLWNRIGKAASPDKESILQILLGLKSGKARSRHWKKRTLDDMARSNLAVQFGWHPFFADIAKLVKSMQSFERIYRDYVRRANTIQSRYYGKWVPGTELPSTTVLNGIDGPQGGWVGPFLAEVGWRYRYEATQGTRYHAVMRYRYPLPAALRDAGGRNKAFLDVLGINGNPAILWNAIPWSFAVDWFVNVGRYLERLRVDNVHFQTEILDFCHSAKVERVALFEQYVTNDIVRPAFTYPNREKVRSGWVATDSCRKREYRRVVGIPNVLGAITTSGLSLREFSLAGSLVGVRKKKVL